jgi:hypothetical protein
VNVELRRRGASHVVSSVLLEPFNIQRL